MARAVPGSRRWNHSHCPTGDTIGLGQGRGVATAGTMVGARVTLLELSCD
jgi:hypothetical protein